MDLLALKKGVSQNIHSNGEANNLFGKDLDVVKFFEKRIHYYFFSALHQYILLITIREKNNYIIPRCSKIGKFKTIVGKNNQISVTFLRETREI